jgi:hypothetical protein
VPPTDVERVNATLQTEPARRLLAALSTYGGYLVDDTAWNATALCTEHGVADEFKDEWGFSFGVDLHSEPNTAQRAWYDDLLALFRALAVVESNSALAPGGGGSPLAPPPPPFCT